MNREFESPPLQQRGGNWLGACPPLHQGPLPSEQYGLIPKGVGQFRIGSGPFQRIKTILLIPSQHPGADRSILLSAMVSPTASCFGMPVC